MGSDNRLDTSRKKSCLPAVVLLKVYLVLLSPEGVVTLQRGRCPEC
jgi:hypothetical protein